MIEPIRLAFEVDCPADHAFDVWTDRISTWWPADHTVSGEPDAAVVLEPRSGRPDLRADGRRRRARVGRGDRLGATEPARLPVAPPARPRRRDRGRDPLPAAGRGGDPASRSSIAAGRRSAPRLRTWRDRNDGGWATLLPHYVAARLGERGHVRVGRVGRRVRGRRRAAPGRPWRRSIQTVVSPRRLAVTWSWYRLWATCRIRSRGRPSRSKASSKLRSVRLVAPGLLGGHDPVEVGAEARGRSREQVVVAVGDDPQPETLVEASQGRRGIREGRPVADRIREGRHLRRVGLDAMAAATPRTPRREDLAIGQIRPGLGGCLDRRVRLQQLIVGAVDAARRQDPAEGGQDPRLPVDERAVAVEGQRLEGAVVEIGHRRIIADRVPGCRSKPARPG